MFNQLLESKPTKQKSVTGTIISVVFHSVLIGGAVWATANAATKAEAPKAEKITFVNTPKDEPPPPPQKKDIPAPPKDMAVAPPPPKGFQELKAPIDVPNVIPDVDLSRRVTNEADFSGKGVAGGVAKGVVGGTGPITSDNTTYFEFNVERPAALDAERSPRPNYPKSLQDAGIVGIVRAQFVVDTSGRAEPGSLKILSSPNELFSQEVRTTLPKMRFFPAEVGGHKVRQLVEQQFSFKFN